MILIFGGTMPYFSFSFLNCDSRNVLFKNNDACLVCFTHSDITVLLLGNKIMNCDCNNLDLYVLFLLSTYFLSLYVLAYTKVWNRGNNCLISACWQTVSLCRVQIICRTLLTFNVCCKLEH